MKLLRETPYAFALENRFAELVCANCLRFRLNSTDPPLHRCSRCRFARYCGKDCQMADFKEHKLQCRLLKKSAPEYPSAFVRLVAQILLKETAKKSKENKGDQEATESDGHPNSSTTSKIQPTDEDSSCNTFSQLKSGKTPKPEPNTFDSAEVVPELKREDAVCPAFCTSEEGKIVATKRLIENMYAENKLETKGSPIGNKIPYMDVITEESDSMLEAAADDSDDVNEAQNEVTNDGSTAKTYTNFQIPSADGGSSEIRETHNGIPNSMEERNVRRSTDGEVAEEHTSKAVDGVGHPSIQHTTGDINFADATTPNEGDGHPDQNGDFEESDSEDILAVRYASDGSAIQLDVNRQLGDLETHFDKLNGGGQVFLRAMVVLQYLGRLNRVMQNFVASGKDSQTLDSSEMKDLAVIWCKTKINSVTVSQRGHRIGMALYLNWSVVNHSCNPNCAQTFDGKDLIIYSLIPGLTWDPAHIDKLSVSYMNIANTTASRKAHLARNYFFDCHCSACSDEEHDLEMVSVVCTACESGLARPLGVPGFDPYKDIVEGTKSAEDDQSAAALAAADPMFDTQLKCSNPSCGAALCVSDYYKEFMTYASINRRLKSLPNGPQNTMTNKDFKSILDDYENLTKIILPKYNVGRYRLAQKINDKIVASQTIGKCVPFLLESHMDIIDFYHNNFRPGHSVVVVNTGNVAILMEMASAEMRSADKDAWRDSKFQKCVAEGKEWCDKHLLVLEEVYGSDYPDCADLQMSLVKFNQHSNWINEEISSGDAQPDSLVGRQSCSELEGVANMFGKV